MNSTSFELAVGLESSSDFLTITFGDLSVGKPLKGFPAILDWEW